MPVGDRLRGQLRGGRGLAGAVDADEEPRIGPTRFEVQRPVRAGGAERGDDLLFEELRARLKGAFDAAGVRLPVQQQQITYEMGGASPPPGAGTTASDPEDIDR